MNKEIKKIQKNEPVKIQFSIDGENWVNSEIKNGKILITIPNDGQ